MGGEPVGGRLVSPSGAVQTCAYSSGDELQYVLTIDTSAGLVVAQEATVALQVFINQIRLVFGLDQEGNQ